MSKIDRKEKGFILIIMLFLMVLLAVVALALNSQTALQARMAANQSGTSQAYFGELAVIEQSLWKLTGDPCWRAASGESYTYNGIPYTRTVANSAVASYQDVVTVSVRSPNASHPVNKSFRYNIETPVQVRNPRQVCLDGSGNMFFADMDNHSVWRIDAMSGAITRVAGTGRNGFSGDGGPATQARLDAPRGVSIDQAGNIYIADTNNNRIRRVTAGIISSVAGGGNPPSGIGDGDAAMLARLNSPYGVFVDAPGNIYIADRDYHRIRKVTVATGIITTVAGSSGGGGFSGDGGPAISAQLNAPRSVFVDATGNIFIADTDNSRIRKVTVVQGTDTGPITTVAGGGASLGDGGQATEAQLNNPRSAYLDATGNLFVADTDNNRIRRVAANTGIISTIVNTSGIAGYSGDGGSATGARIDNPTGLAVKATGEVIISDTNNGCLRQVDISSTISTLSMTAGPGLNNAIQISSYYDSAQKKLFLYIADSGNNRIRKLDTATNTISTVAGTGGWGFSGDGGLAINAQLRDPEGIAASYDTIQNKLFLYIADTDNHRIRKVDTSSGIISTVVGTGVAGSSGDDGLATSAQLDTPRAIAVDNAQNIYIADTGNNKIRKVSATTGIITTFAGGGTSQGDPEDPTKLQLSSPSGVFVDAAGNVYFSDTGHHKIRRVSAAGITLRVAGSGNEAYSGDGGSAILARIDHPRGVAADEAGNIYIADTDNHRLRLVNIHDGTISTMAGTGSSVSGGYNGDNQPAVTARLNSPAGVALGLTKAGGRIFISDSNNNRIRMLFLKTTPEVYGP